MLEKVKQYALEKYAGDEALADKFVEGFVKAADWVTPPNRDDHYVPGLRNLLNEGATTSIGKGLGSLAVGLGVHGLNAAFSVAESGALHSKFLEALVKAVSTNPILQEAKKEKAAEAKTKREKKPTVKKTVARKK
jgi:hypothetical protein